MLNVYNGTRDTIVIMSSSDHINVSKDVLDEVDINRDGVPFCVCVCVCGWVRGIGREIVNKIHLVLRLSTLLLLQSGLGRLWLRS